MYARVRIPPTLPFFKLVSMGMIFGVSDTILGVGTPELFVILAVGYFVLGPVELFKLTKQAGVLLGQLKDIGLGTVTNLGSIMDEQVLHLVCFFNLVVHRGVCFVIEGMLIPKR